MNKRAQRICVWSGVLGIVFFFIGFWPMAHFLPPLSPAWTGQQVADFYLNNSVGVRVGAVLIIFSAALSVLFYTAITIQMQRIEGGFGPLSLAQIALGVLAIMPFVPASIAMCVASFRAERDVADILLMSDYTWIMFFVVASPAMLQYFTFGYAILTDTHRTPILPRWLGYFVFWIAILGMPGNVIVFFYGGPFAWSGLFGYWIPATIFGLWTGVVAWQLLKAIDREPDRAVMDSMD